MAVSDRVLSARKRRGWSQAELAKRAGLQPSAVSHFETGNREPSFRNIAVLARTLHVSADYLCGLDRQLSANLHPLMQDFFSLKSGDRKLLTRFAKRLVQS